MAQRKALGKGLSALIPEKVEKPGMQELEVGEIEPNRFQPREDVDRQGLEEMVSP